MEAWPLLVVPGASTETALVLAFGQVFIRVWNSAELAPVKAWPVLGVPGASAEDALVHVLRAGAWNQCSAC